MHEQLLFQLDLINKFLESLGSHWLLRHNFEVDIPAATLHDLKFVWNTLDPVRSSESPKSRGICF